MTSPESKSDCYQGTLAPNLPVLSRAASCSARVSLAKSKKPSACAWRDTNAAKARSAHEPDMRAHCIDYMRTALWRIPGSPAGPCHLSIAQQCELDVRSRLSVMSALNSGVDIMI